MHWLEKWRRRNGYTQWQLAEKVHVSVVLIDILENQNNAVTHPLIANEIAQFTGATAKQRDSIVHKKHRGKWQPGPKTKNAAGIKAMPDSDRDRTAALLRRGSARPVLQININCDPVTQWPSLQAAAQAVGKQTPFVYDRCRKRLKGNEFEPMGCTYRYADEWCAEMRKQLLVAAEEYKKSRRADVHKFGGTTFITLDGVCRSTREWEKLTGIKAATILQRIRSGKSVQDALMEPLRKRKGEKT